VENTVKCDLNVVYSMGQTTALHCQLSFTGVRRTTYYRNRL